MCVTGSEKKKKESNPLSAVGVFQFVTWLDCYISTFFYVEGGGLLLHLLTSEKNKKQNKEQ